MLIKEYKDVYLREVRYSINRLAKLDGQVYVKENINLLISENASEKFKAIDALNQALESLPTYSYSLRTELKKQISKLEREI